MDIRINKVALQNLNQLQDISKQTFCETFSDNNTKENMQKYLDEELSLDKLNLELKNENSEFYFATLDNKVIGYLKINFGEAQTELKNEVSLEIERIYVLKEFLGTTVGKLLYHKALQIAKQMKAKYIWLGVWEKNARAINFYIKNGFIEFNKHIFRLGNDQQVDIMMKLNL